MKQIMMLVNAEKASLLEKEMLKILMSLLNDSKFKRKI